VKDIDMSRRLAFDFDVERFVAATSFLVEKCPEVTKIKLFKLLYFADKRHLLTYGRPIIGDRYIKMDHGPVPSKGYNLVKRDERANAEDQELFDAYVTVQGNDLKTVNPPNLAYLSETEIEVLDEVVREYGLLTAGQLSKLSHRDPAWMNAELNSDMDLRWIFVGGSENERLMERLAQEDQELRDELIEAGFEGPFAEV